MIKCICVNDNDKPNDIPQRKWIKKGNKYNVIYSVTVLPQRQLGLILHEIELDNTCAPYEYFLASRFAFAEEDLAELIQMIKDCNEINFSIDELMKQTETVAV